MNAEIKRSALVVIRGDGSRQNPRELVVTLHVDVSVYELELKELVRYAKSLTTEAQHVQRLLVANPDTTGSGSSVSSVRVLPKDHHLFLNVQVVMPRSHNDRRNAATYKRVRSTAEQAARARGFKVE